MLLEKESKDIEYRLCMGNISGNILSDKIFKVNKRYIRSRADGVLLQSDDRQEWELFAVARGVKREQGEVRIWKS